MNRMLDRPPLDPAAKSLQRPARHGRLRDSSSQLGQALSSQLLAVTIYPHASFGGVVFPDPNRRGCRRSLSSGQETGRSLKVSAGRRPERTSRIAYEDINPLVQ